MANTGVVKWFDRKKGIGFATPADGGEDVFIHRRNFRKDTETGKAFILDEGDEIYFNMGEYEGRATAIEISLPIGAEKKTTPRKFRGRNAKKELDAEAAKEDEVATGAPEGEEASAPAAGADASAGAARDSKTHRRGNQYNRQRRNDKGVAAAGSVDKGFSSARRSDNRGEANRAHRETTAA